jgi:hypothetical protein
MMNTTADEMLAKLGLQTRTTARDYMLPVLGIFGLGMLIGAGIVVIAVPQVREQVRDRLRRGASKVRDVAEQAKDKLDEAKEQLKERVGGNGAGNGRGQQAGDDFQAMTREQLVERAKSMNVQTRANMTKNELIEALSSSPGSMSSAASR